MPTKKGAGGRLQNYDSHGRYAKTNYFLVKTPKESKKEKAQRKEETRREELFNRAKKSKDQYLFDVFLAIEKEMPGEVTAVNEKRFDENENRYRELDIITKKCIIEVKSGSGKNQTKQFSAQKLWAQQHGKTYMIFAPQMASGTLKYLKWNNFMVCQNFNELICKMQEVSK